MEFAVVSLDEDEDYIVIIAGGDGIYIHGEGLEGSIVIGHHLRAKKFIEAFRKAVDEMDWEMGEMGEEV